MRAFFQTNRQTKWAVFAIVIAICSVTFHLKQWENPKKVIASDVKGYYGYLPALFIHDDIKLDDIEVYKYDGEFNIWFSTTEENQRYIKFPPGMAVLYSPFFAIAHIQASIGESPADGYSYPYRFWLAMGSLLYTLIGLYFICKLLLLHFSDRVTAVTLIVLYLGSNLFYYTAYDGQLTHNYSFALLSGFMYGCVRWLENPRWKFALLVGICGGMLVAVRHIDLLFLPFILLYGIKSWRDIKPRFLLVWQHRWMTLAAIALILVCLIPQFLYHLYLFGDLFHYAYDEERFFFGSPHLYDSLLSFRNGWLIYSPIMILSLVGIVLMYKRVGKIVVFILASIPLYYYVIASWWCWWFVGFGNRAYINMYPVLAFGIAALLTYLYEKRYFVSVPAHLAILMAIVLNFFQSYQFSSGILHWDGMTSEGYWNAFGREEPTQLQHILIASPDNIAAKKGKDFVFVTDMDTLAVYHYGFEKERIADSSYASLRSKDHAFLGRYGIGFPEGYEYGLLNKFRVPKGTSHIYISAWIKGDGEQLIAVQSDTPKPFSHLSKEIIERKSGWNKVHILATPFQDVTYDSMNFFIWNQTIKPFSVDRVRVVCMKAKTIRRPY